MLRLRFTYWLLLWLTVRFPLGLSFRPLGFRLWLDRDLFEYIIKLSIVVMDS